MHARMIRTIFSKDLIDAIRDARVLVAIIVPIGIGLFYNATIGDTDPSTPSYRLAIASEGPTALPDAIRQVVGSGVELDIRQASGAAEVERLVAADDADLGLIVPAGFDEAVRQAATSGAPPPQLGVREPDAPTGGTVFLVQATEPALRQLAGQQLPVAFETTTAAAEPEDQIIFERVGFREYLVLGSVVFVIVMVSMLAVPVILAEETEKKTLDALVMIASYWDVILGKALVGLVYAAVSVAVLLGLTRLGPADYATFGAALLLLTITLIGFGLFVGGLFRNANQINTWSGVLLIPVLAPVFLVGVPGPRWLDVLLQIWPTSQGTRLAINGLTGERIFDRAWLSYTVIVAWGAVAYGLLHWQLQRRQA